MTNLKICFIFCCGIVWAQSTNPNWYQLLDEKIENIQNGAELKPFWMSWKDMWDQWYFQAEDRISVKILYKISQFGCS